VAANIHNASPTALRATVSLVFKSILPFDLSRFSRAIL
jgi:hypothetical protein